VIHTLQQRRKIKRTISIVDTVHHSELAETNCTAVTAVNILHSGISRGPEKPPAPEKAVKDQAAGFSRETHCTVVSAEKPKKHSGISRENPLYSGISRETH
jgi:hypothetical protein